MVIKTPWVKRERIDTGIIRIIFLVLAIISVVYISKLSGVFVSPQWEHVDAVTVDAAAENVTYTITFDKYKPVKCEDGIYVSDGDTNIDFEVTDSERLGGYCVKATIMFKNAIYQAQEEQASGQSASEPAAETPEVKTAKEQIEEKEETVRVAEEKGSVITVTGRTVDDLTASATEEITGSFQEEQFKTYYIFYGVISENPTPVFGEEKEKARAQEEKVTEAPELVSERTPASELLSEIQMPVNQTNETINGTVNETVFVIPNDTISFSEITIDTTYNGYFNSRLNSENTVYVDLLDGTSVNFGISSINNITLNQVNATKYMGDTWYEKIVYENILNNISLEYTLDYDSVKEYIVLENKQELTDDFVVSELLSFSGIDEISFYNDAKVIQKSTSPIASSSYPIQKQDASLVLEQQNISDKRFKSSALGESASKVSVEDMGILIESIETQKDIDFNVQTGTKFYIPAGKVYDSDGAETEATYVISNDKGNVVLNIVVDDEWLLDEDRVYPVYIDPSITTVQPRTSEIGWVNDLQPGRQYEPFPAFYNTAGDYVVTWFNFSGADGVTNALKAKQFNDFTTVNLSQEYDFTQCNEKRIPEYYAGIGSVNQIYLHSTAASEAGGEIITVYTNGSNGVGTGNDVYMTWARPAQGFGELMSGESCTNGGGMGFARPTTPMGQTTSVNQQIPYAAASTDGNRYGACWQSYLGSYPNWEIVFRLWDGTPTGYNYQTTPVTPTSNNNCGSFCTGYEASASSQESSDRDLTCVMDFQVNSSNYFAVCWVRYDGSVRYNGLCKVFNSTGYAKTSSFAYESTANSVRASDLVWLDNDRFVIAYTEFSTYYAAKFSIFFANGTAIAADQTVNATGSLHHAWPSVARLENGNFIYVYQANFGGATDYDILGAIYDKNGNLVSSPSHFIVNEYRTGPQTYPRVESRNGTNEYVVTWQSQNDSDWEGVKMRLFGSAGPSVSSLTINSTDGHNLTTEDVTAYAKFTDPDNDFVFPIYDWKKNGQSIMAGLWPFDSNEDTRAKDYSSNGNNGTIYGNPVWTEDGKIGGAYALDGSGDYISTGADISGDGTFSIGFWLYDKSTTYAYRRWVTTTVGAFGTNTVVIRETSAGEIQFYCGSSYSAVTSGKAGSWKNKWTHFSIVSNGAKCMLYENGVNILNTSGTTSNPETGFYIGGYYSTGEYTNGTIDDVKVYTSNLSTEQIQQIYFEGSEIGKWTFDKNELTDSSTIRDVSGYGNDGSCTNCPAWSTSYGKVSGGYYFDGSNDVVPVGTGITTYPQMTLMGWGYISSTQTADMEMTGYTHSNSFNGYGFSLLFDYVDAATTYFRAKAATNNDPYFYNNVYVNVNSYEDQWAHYALTWENLNTGTGGCDARVAMYINGELVDNATYNMYGNGAYNCKNPYPYPFSIGARAVTSTAYPFKGYIDDIRVFNQAFTEEQIEQKYKEGLYGYSSAIVSAETDIGDKWSATVTPNDLFSDGTASSTSNMTIMDNPEVTACKNLTSSSAYILTADISGNQSGGICIDVQANDTILDCAGHKIVGSYGGTTKGVRIGTGHSTVTNNTIINCTIANYYVGVDGSYVIYNSTIENITYTGLAGGGIVVNSIIRNATSSAIVGGTVSSGFPRLKINDTLIDICGTGLYTYSSGQFYRNNISNCDTGIAINYVQGNDNIIAHNRISAKWAANVSSTDNFLYNNLFYGVVTDDGTNTLWNTTNSTGPNIAGGPYIGGNFYGGATYLGTDTDGDGFGQTTYNIPGSGGGVDDLPLINYILSCTNITSSGTYKLNSDLSGVQTGLNYCINVSADNVMISGNNKKIDGNGVANRDYGIYVDSSDNVTISNLTVEDYTGQAGIIYFDSSNGTLEYSKLIDCDNNGIYVAYGDYTIIRHNNITSSDNQPAIHFFQTNYSEINNNTLSNSYSGVLVSFSKQASIKNNIVSGNTEYGIAISQSWFSSFSNITNNTVTGSGNAGISFQSDYGRVINNTVVNNYIGISVVESQHSILDNNNASFNTEADFAEIGSSSLNNTVTRLTTADGIINLTAQNIYLKSASAPAGPDPTGYTNIGHYLNITNTTEPGWVSWIYINISYTADDVSGVVDNSTLRIWKNASGGWNQYLNKTGALVSGVNTAGQYVYANISNFSSNIFAPMGQAIDPCNIIAGQLYTMLGNLTCTNLYIAATGILDTNGYNVTVTNNAEINGTLHGRTGAHRFNNVTINSGGLYNTTSGTTFSNGTIAVNSGGTFDVQNNAVLNVTNFTHVSGATTGMGAGSTWHVYGKFITDTGYDAETSIMYMYSGSEIAPVSTFQNNFAYHLIVPQGQTVRKTGTYFSVDGKVEINGTIDYISGNQQIVTWYISNINNFIIGPNADVSELELNMVGNTAVPESTWYRILIANGGTGTFYGNITCLTTGSPYVSHWSTTSYSALNLSGYTLNASNAASMYLGSTSGAGGRLYMEGGQIILPAGTFNVYGNNSLLEGTGAGKISANKFEHNGSLYVNLSATALNITDRVYVNGTFRAGSGSHRYGSINISSTGVYFAESAVHNITGNLDVTGILHANTSNIIVNGDWNTALGTFYRGTSWVNLTGTGVLYAKNSWDGGNTPFYRLSVAYPGKTTTMTNSMFIYGSFYLNGGTYAMQGYTQNNYGYSIDDKAFIYGSGTITSTGGYLRIKTGNTGMIWNDSVFIPYFAMDLINCNGGANYTLLMKKDMNAGTIIMPSATSGLCNDSYVIINMSGNNINATDFTVGGNGITHMKVQDNSTGNLTLSGALFIGNYSVVRMTNGNMSIAGNVTADINSLIDGGTGMHSFGSLTTASGSTYNATSGKTIITSETPGGYALDLDGTFTSNNGELVISTPADTYIDSYSNDGGRIYNLTSNSTGTVSRVEWGVTGGAPDYDNLNIIKGIFKVNDNFYNLTVSGDTFVSGGTLGHSAWNGTSALGAMTVGSGGKYIASTGTNAFGDNVVVDNGGTFEAIGSANTVWFNGNFTTNGTTYWKDSTVRFNGTSRCEFYWITRTHANMTVINSTVSNNGSDVSLNTYGARWESGRNGVLNIQNSIIEAAGDQYNCPSWGTGIYMYSGNINVINNTFNSPVGREMQIDGGGNYAINFTYNNVTMNVYGLLLASADYCNVKYNNFTSSNFIGVYVYNNADWNNISYNNIWGGTGTDDDPMYVYNSKNNTITYNNIYTRGSSTKSIYLFNGSGGSSYGNVISYNNLSCNGDAAIQLQDNVYNNNISYNNASNCAYSTAINLTAGTYDNRIWNNYFNGSGADYGTNNLWNITKTSGTNIIGGSWLGGNYWSVYTGYDTDGDGLGNVPYSLSGTAGSKDYLPLTDVDGCHITTSVTLQGNLACTTLNITSTGTLNSGSYNVSTTDYINVSGTWNAGTGYHSIGGNWYSETGSAFNCGTSTVEFIKSGTAIIDVDTSVTFNNLKMANANNRNVSLAGAGYMNVQGALSEFGTNSGMSKIDFVAEWIYFYIEPTFNTYLNQTGTTGGIDYPHGVRNVEQTTANNAYWNLRFSCNAVLCVANLTGDTYVKSDVYTASSAGRSQTFDLKGFNLTVLDDMIVGSNDTFNAGGGQFNVTGDVTVEADAKLDAGAQNHIFGALLINSGGNYTCTESMATITSNASGNWGVNIDGAINGNLSLNMTEPTGIAYLDIVATSGNIKNILFNGPVTFYVGDANWRITGDMNLTTGSVYAYGGSENGTIDGSLVIAPSKTLRFGSGANTLTIGKNLEIGSGATFGIGTWAGKLTIGGDMIGPGTYSHGAQEVDFNGASPTTQLVKGNFTFHNMTVSGYYVQLRNDTTIENALTVNSGKYLIANAVDKAGNIAIILGNSTQSGNIYNSGEIRGKWTTGYNVTWQAASINYFSTLNGAGTYDWDYGTTNGQVHWRWLNHKGTHSTAMQTGGGGVTIVLDGRNNFYENWTVSSGDTFTVGNNDIGFYKAGGVITRIGTETQTGGITIIAPGGTSMRFVDWNSQAFRQYSTLPVSFDGTVTAYNVLWSSTGPIIPYDSAAVINVANGIIVPTSAYFGADASGNMGDGNPASNWNANMSWGYIQLDGGTITTPKGIVNMTSESAGGYVIERTTNGGNINAQGTLNVTYPGATVIYMRSFSPTYTLGDIIVQNSGNTLYFQSAYVNNLTQNSGLVRGASNPDGFHASGKVAVNAGTLGHSTWSFSPSWGSLYVASGATFYAPNGTTNITSRYFDGSTYLVMDVDAGTFYHDNGKVLITSPAWGLIQTSRTGVKNAFYDLEINTPSQTIYYGYSDGLYVDNDLTVTAGTLRRGDSALSKNLTVSGDAAVSGALGVSTATGNNTFNTLTVNQGATYTATSTYTNIGDYISLNGTYSYNGGSVNISGTNTKFASASNVRLDKVTSPPADPANYANISYYVNITNLTPTGGFNGQYFNITYLGTEPSDETKLDMWKHNGTSWTQNGIVSSGVNTANNYVYANISGFSTFGPLEQTNVAPTISTLVINSTDGSNDTNQNLTVWATTSDADGDLRSSIFNWKVNGGEIAKLIMPMDVESSTETRDYTSSGNNGTVYNAVWNSSGKIGGAYNVDGSTSYISVPHSSSINISGSEITVSVWAYYVDVDSTDHPLVSKSDQTLWDPTDGWMLGFGWGNDLWWGTAGNRVLVTYAGTNAWHHYVGTYNGTTLKIYVDGVLRASNTTTGNVGTSTHDLWIGHAKRGNAYFNGSIDEVRLYDRALSQEQINQMYIEGRDGLTLNSSSTIVSQETEIGENWSAVVTVNDMIVDGDSDETYNLTINDPCHITTTVLLSANLTCTNGMNITSTGVLNTAGYDVIVTGNLNDSGILNSTGATFVNVSGNAIVYSGAALGYSTWAGNATLGSLTTNSGSTLSGNGILITVTSEDSNGYAINIDGAISGNVDVKTTYGGDTWADMTGTSGNIRNFNCSTGGFTAFVGDTVLTGNLTVSAGRFRQLADVDKLTVNGNVVINSGGILGTTNWAANATFGSLTIDSGGTVYATNATTSLSGSMSGTGTFYHDSGEMKMTGSETNINNGFTFYNLTIAASGVKFYNSADTEWTILNLLKINSGASVGTQTYARDYNVTLGNSTQAATVDNSGAFNVNRNWQSGGSTTIKAVSSSYYANLGGSGTYDWDYGSSGSEVHWKWLKHQGTHYTAMQTGGAGITIVLDEGVYFEQNFTISSGDLFNQNGMRIYSFKNFTNEGSMIGGGTFKPATTADHYYLNVNATSLQVESNGLSAFDGNNYFGNIQWNGANNGEVVPYDASSVLNVTGGINVSNAGTYFGADASGNMGDGNPASNWNANMSWGWIEHSGAGLTLPLGRLTLTSESGSGYAIKMNTNGFTLNNNNIWITYGSSTYLNTYGSGGKNLLYDLTVNDSAAVVYLNDNPTNIRHNLTVVKGTVRADDAKSITVTGDALIENGGTLGHSAWTGNASFGSLTVNSGGTYNATSGTTTITSRDSSSISVNFNSGSTVNHNNGKFKIQSSLFSYFEIRDYLYDLEINNSNVDAIFGRWTSSNTVQHDLTITNVRFFQGYNSADNLVVNGNVTINAGQFRGYTGTHSFGSLTVNSGGTYVDTSVQTKIGDYISINGTYTYSGGSVNLTGGSKWVNTKFASASNVKLQKVTSPPIDPDNYVNIGYYVNITNLTQTGGFNGTYFNITYEAGDPADETRLDMWRYNGTNWTQTGIASSGVDTTNNHVWANISGFSIFAPLEQTNVAPTISSLDVNPDPIYLTPCGNVTVNCTATVADANGYDDISNVKAVLYNDDLTNSDCSANNTKCYLNNSCALTGCSGTSCTANCTFWNVRYYAKAGNWKCNITANDSSGEVNSSDSTATLNNLTAIATGASISFGEILPGDYSANLSHNIINCGNYEIDTKHNGTDMECTVGSKVIGVGNISYSASQAGGYTSLTNILTKLDLNISAAITDSGSNGNSWWRLFVPSGLAGSCSGNVTFLAVQSI